MLHSQRAGVAESLVERSLLNGPRRAWRNAFLLSIRDVRHTLHAQDMMVSVKRTFFCVNQGGTAESVYFRP